MKKILTFGGVIAVTALTTFALSDFLSGSSDLPESFIKAQLYSAILNQERELFIHLPREYDSTKKYPVMYVLDGGTDDLHIATIVGILSTAGHTPSTIVVGIPNMSAENRQRNLVPPFMRIDADQPDSPPGGGDQFLSFIESELIPFIEKKYGASDIRLFSGHSRGGLLVMYSLLYKHHLFSARFCYSTPFWRQDDILIDRVADFLSNTDSLEAFLYMSAGEKETENIKGGLDRMNKTLHDKAPDGFIWYTDITADAVHQNNARISAPRGIARWGEYFNSQQFRK